MILLAPNWGDLVSLNSLNWGDLVEFVLKSSLVQIEIVIILHSLPSSKHKILMPPKTFLRLPSISTPGSFRVKTKVFHNLLKYLSSDIHLDMFNISVCPTCSFSFVLSVVSKFISFLSKFHFFKEV